MINKDDPVCMTGFCFILFYNNKDFSCSKNEMMKKGLGLNPGSFCFGAYRFYSSTLCGVQLLHHVTVINIIQGIVRIYYVFGMKN